MRNDGVNNFHIAPEHPQIFGNRPSLAIRYHGNTHTSHPRQ
jgi:hypothetical protein